MLLISTDTGGACVFHLMMDVTLEMVCRAGKNLICCGGRAWLLYLLVKTVRGIRYTVKRCHHNV